MYRFLAMPRWLGLAAIMLVAAAVMAGLGRWQLHRYDERAAGNARIDAAGRLAPVPLTDIVAEAAVGGGQSPPTAAAWSRVQVSGVYDGSREILARGRTVAGRVGFEIITPLRLPDGSAVLVDRGWVPPSPRGASARPDVPRAPTGTVTVVGRIHLTESGARPVEPALANDGRGASGGAASGADGAVGQVRRVGVPEISAVLPYPVYGAYLLADPVEPGLVAIPIRHEASWQNAGYVVQWWLLAALTLVGFGYLARREARSARTASMVSASAALLSSR